MKTFEIIAASAVLLSVAAAAPKPDAPHYPLSTNHTVSWLPLDVNGPITDDLKDIPADHPADAKAFLEKYQPLAKAASDYIGEKNHDSFTSSGHCFKQYPCFSIEKSAVAHIGSKKEITRKQMSNLLDKIVENDKVTFNQSNKDIILSGLKMTVDGVTLQVISPPGEMPAKVLAGIAFDVFKMQCDDSNSNAIGGAVAKSDGKDEPLQAVCLYPEGANKNEAHNFCRGQNLDGSDSHPAQPHVTKRFSLFGTFCQVVEIPLLC